MLHATYEIWGLGLVALLIGIWTVKAVLNRKSTRRTNGSRHGAAGTTRADQDIEHRALMYLMAQKTDSLLGALAQTIEQERQKLGGVVRNPSMETALDAMEAVSAPATNNGRSKDAAILPMAQRGMDAAAIARQLRLPEAEVDLIMRRKAA